MNYESRVMVQRRGKARDLTVCGLFSALIAVGAFIKIVIPVGADSMNFTLQWFFVLLAGLLLGSKRAFLSVSTYLLIGLMGIPVFARGGGPAYLLRPTFGFLLGFALAAYAMGKICEWLHSSKPGTWIFAASVGYVIYYGMGILYFYFITHWIVVTPNTVGWGAIFAVYCLPTMFRTLCCVCLPSWWRGGCGRSWRRYWGNGRTGSGNHDNDRTRSYLYAGAAGIRPSVWRFRLYITRKTL